MKKSLVALIALFVSILFILPSCKPSTEGPEKITDAATLWKKINEKMSSLDSYEATAEIQMVFDIGGYAVNSNATEKRIESGRQTDSPYFYSDASYSVSCKDLGIDEQLSELSAYYNGNAFMSTKAKDVEQKLYSAMTAKEYQDYILEKTTLSDTGDILNASNVTFEQTENEAWTICCSNYSDEVLQKYINEFDTEEMSLGENISDMELSVSADKDFRATLLSIKFVFDTEADEKIQKKLEATITYQKYNEATPITETLSTEDFKQVADIRVIDTVEKSITDIQNAQQAKCTLNLKQSFTLRGETSTYEEKDIITYGGKGDSYYYKIQATSQGSTFSMNYKNGSETVSQGSTTTSKNKTPEEAKEFIDSLINSAKYSKNSVENVEKIGDGIYKLECRVIDATPYKNVFDSIRGEYTGATQTITVTIEEGKVVKVESIVEAKGTYQYQNAIYRTTLIVETSCTYEIIDTTEESSQL